MSTGRVSRATRRPPGPPPERPRPAATADPAAPMVAAARCSTCVFRPGNALDLHPGRLAQVIADNRARGTVLPCHLTTHGQWPEPAMCRGYWDTYGAEAGTVQMVYRLGGHFRAVDVDGAPPSASTTGRGLLRP